MQEFRETRFCAPALTLIVQLFDAAARDETVAQCCSRRQLRLLFDEHDAQAVLARELAVVERERAGDRLQQ